MSTSETVGEEIVAENTDLYQELTPLVEYVHAKAIKATDDTSRSGSNRPRLEDYNIGFMDGYAEAWRTFESILKRFQADGVVP